LGIGDWGLGIGDWAQSPIPNPQIYILIIFLEINERKTNKLKLKIILYINIDHFICPELNLIFLLKIANLSLLCLKLDITSPKL